MNEDAVKAVCIFSHSAYAVVYAMQNSVSIPSYFGETFDSTTVT